MHNSNGGLLAGRDEAGCQSRRLQLLQSELEFYECKLNGYENAFRELEGQVASKDEQLRAFKALWQAGDGRGRQSVLPLQLHMLEAALHTANTRLRSAGLDAVTPEEPSLRWKETPLCASAASSLSLPSPLEPEAAHSAPDGVGAGAWGVCAASIDAPSTPLCPQATEAAPRHPLLAMAEGQPLPWGCPASTTTPEPLSPTRHGAPLHPGCGSPDAALSARSVGWPAGALPATPSCGDLAYNGERRCTTEHVNPLFRYSSERGARGGRFAGGSRALASPEAVVWRGGALAGRASDGVVDVHAQCVLDRADLQLQLQRAQQLLAQASSLAGVADKQAGDAHARLNHSVRSLGRLYILLKELLEEAGQGDQHALQRRLAESIEELSQLAKSHMEVAAYVDALGGLLAQLKGGGAGGAS